MMGIEEAWKSTCKVLLGEEIGDLEQFEEYLKKYIDSVPLRKKSALSGKEVSVFSKEICEGAKYISNDESGAYLKAIGAKPFDINKIKDIDSLLEEVGERAYYAGNIVLGNSSEVKYSDRCIDVHFCYKSNMIVAQSKYIAYSEECRISEYLFGCTLSGEAKFEIHGYETWKNSRCMEVFCTYQSSDCYYTANLEACMNCMFSFNQRNKTNMIGNLQLSKENYEGLKKKLLPEIADILKRKKALPTIIDIAGPSDSGKRGEAEGLINLDAPQENVDEAFRTTCQLVLGKQIGALKDYQDYLGKHVGKVTKVRSSASQKPVLIAPLLAYQALIGNVLEYDEALEFGNKRLKESEIGKLTVGNAKALLGEIARTTPEVKTGLNIDIKDTACYGSNSTSVYGSAFAYGDKLVSNTYFVRDSEYIFGSSLLFSCSQCIKCYNSTKITRCFEMEGCTNCRDSYFCHNSENLDNCMFCFNAKSLRYAIGNVEVGRESYMKIKKLMLDEIAGKLERDKRLDLSVYNVGCKRA